MTFLIAAVAPACSDNGMADADIAIAEGLQAGDQQAALVDADLAGEVNPDIVIAKSVMIVLTIDAAAIACAEVTLPATTNSHVVDFAQAMVEAHTADQAVSLDLLASYELAARDSDVSLDLRQDADGWVANIAAGANVDYKYTRIQVVMLNEAFVIAGALELHAPESNVAGFLADARAKIDAHRQSAQVLLRDMD